MADLEYGQDRAKEILILGGGFGGVSAAMELEKQLKRELQNGSVRVTLVARENFFLFTPLLHEVAASDLDPSNIVNPIRKLLKRAEFFRGENVFGFQFSGFLAWVMWRGIYLSKLPRFEKKLRVALDCVFSKDLVQLSTSINSNRDASQMAPGAPQGTI